MAAPNRYSTLISWVKVLLPLAALALLSTLFLFSGRPDPEDALIISDIDIEGLARDQVLSRPRFAGTLEDGRALLFSAESAAPVADTADQFIAQSISARLMLAPELEALLNAAEAEVDMTAQEARLAGGVAVTRTDGVRLQTEALTMGLAVLSAIAPGPVEIVGPGLELKAGAMELTEADGAQVLSFSGGVEVIYSPRNQRSP